MLLDDKTILITGGTGSFGKCFTKYVMEHSHPKKVIIYSRDEFKQWMMANELKEYEDRSGFSSVMYGIWRGCAGLSTEWIM